MNKLNHTNTIKNDRFPSSLFLVYFLVLLLMSGIHTGIIVGMNALGWNKIIQVILPLGYWTVVAVGLTLFTKNVIRKSYEKPMHDLADATKKVAEGDFSVYVPTLHTADRLDYLDVMIIDFNKMVEELGSIETLKTDFFSNVSHEIKTLPEPAAAIPRPRDRHRGASVPGSNDLKERHPLGEVGP